MAGPLVTQQSILQVSIAERIQQVQQQHPDMQQRYFAHELTQERIKKLSKVNSFEGMEQIRLTDKRENKHSRNRQSKGGQTTQNSEAAVTEDRPARIDIKA